MIKMNKNIYGFVNLVKMLIGDAELEFSHVLIKYKSSYNKKQKKIGWYKST